MPLTLFETLASGGPAEMVLLTTLPASSDPSTWTTLGFQPSPCNVTPSGDPHAGGVSVVVQGNCPVPQGEWSAEAYGVLQDGVCLFFGLLDPPARGYGGGGLPVQVLAQVNPVLR